LKITITIPSPVITVDGTKRGHTPEERRALADTITGILMEQTAARKYLPESCQPAQSQPPCSTEQELPEEK
jgi:hypothetical protein